MTHRYWHGFGFYRSDATSLFLFAPRVNVIWRGDGVLWRVRFGPLALEWRLRR